MTDSGYVAGGYGVTLVAIGAYVGHMWARGRTLASATARGAENGFSEDPSSPEEAR